MRFLHLLRYLHYQRGAVNQDIPRTVFRFINQHVIPTPETITRTTQSFLSHDNINHAGVMNPLLHRFPGTRLHLPIYGPGNKVHPSWLKTTLHHLVFAYAIANSISTRLYLSPSGLHVVDGELSVRDRLSCWTNCDFVSYFFNCTVSCLWQVKEHPHLESPIVSARRQHI